eukprot:maker-scaffold303_size215788-snap-gene-1.11 protein:Tk07116 transcript:maker-scaffold303_size215788-snap-gene-1.11-mRNA-1 annotation:"ras guanine nucleotide exchange factor f"
MIVFGGERDGQVLNEMWRFHFATEFWEKLSFATNQPMPRAQTTAFIFSQFRTRGTVHYMGLPEQDYFGSKPEPVIPNRVGKAEHYQNGDRSTLSNSKEDPSRNSHKYTFASPETCVDDTTCLAGKPEVPPNFLGRKSSQMQRLDSLRSGASSTLIKDFAKISNLNISRLSNYCSYSMFSNDSTESLNTASSTASPCSVRLAKSRSSQQLLNLTLQDLESPSAKGPQGETGLPRDPVSVPNFRTLAKSNSLDSDDGTKEPSRILEKASNLLNAKAPPAKSPHLPLECLTNPNAITDIGLDSMRAPCRSDSDYTFQSYDCSSRSSTLSSQNSSSLIIPKSSSINRGFFSGETKLVDLEEEEAATFYSSDEFSSLSGYESIEAVNREDCESRMSFANPHYLGPDVQSIIDRKRAVQSNSLLRDESHQSFAQALNSPADSLYSDYQDFNARLNQDLVELNQFPSYQSGQGGSMVSNPAKVVSTFSRREPKTPANVSAVSTPCGTIPQPVKKPARPISTEIPRVNKISPMKTNPHEPEMGENQLMLLMYILGGREVGQVTVFKRPISVWKLDLTKTF